MNNTYTEKQIRDAIIDWLMEGIARNNDGVLSTVRSTDFSFKVLAMEKISISGNTVTQNGVVIYKIVRRYSSKKIRGSYRELKPTLEAV